MAGLKNMLKMFGRMRVAGIMWVYDYATDEAVKESDMTKERMKASEKAKYEKLKELADKAKGL